MSDRGDTAAATAAGQWGRQRAELVLAIRKNTSARGDLDKRTVDVICSFIGHFWRLVDMGPVADATVESLIGVAATPEDTTPATEGAAMTDEAATARACPHGYDGAHTVYAELLVSGCHGFESRPIGTCPGPVADRITEDTTTATADGGER